MAQFHSMGNVAHLLGPSYTYDLGGNRVGKTDHMANVVTYYHYHITDEDDGGQHNNRLLHSPVGSTVRTGPWMRRSQ